MRLHRKLIYVIDVLYSVPVDSSRAEMYGGGQLSQRIFVTI